MTRADPTIEAVARAIYDVVRQDHPEGKRRPWMDGGNSLVQDEARRCARLALETFRLPTRT